MVVFVWNILLMLTWAAARGDFSFVNLVLGFALGYLVLLVSQRVMRPTRYFHRAHQWFRLALYFGRELVLANLRLIYHVLTPTRRTRAAVIAIPLAAQTDEEITAVGSLLTLIPGSVLLDVSDDRTTMYVHVIFGEDLEARRRDVVEQLVPKVLEAFR